jgi:hypothetical protein
MDGDGTTVEKTYNSNTTFPAANTCYRFTPWYRDTVLGRFNHEGHGVYTKNAKEESKLCVLCETFVVSVVNIPF